MYQNKEQHEMEIKYSHTQGFGGSDADILYRIGLNRDVFSLPITFLRRIGVVMGLYEPEKVLTAAMSTGHSFEDFYISDSNIQTNTVLLARSGEREYKLQPEKQPDNFLIFAHADYYNQGSVMELKFSKVNSINNIYSKYYYQLQWYYMLGVEKVYLVYYDGSDFENTFYPQNIISKEIERNEEVIETIRNGIRILDSQWQETKVFLSDSLSIKEEDLLPFDRLNIQSLYDTFVAMKRAQEAVDKCKGVILSMMESYRIKQIKSEHYTVSYKAPTTQRAFNVNAAKADHPEIDWERYYKTSNVKSSITIKIQD